LRPTFFGLNTANSGLYMAQLQIDVVGHNLANTNVQGYTRQRFASQAVNPGYYPPQLVNAQRGTPGYGVKALSLDQIRDVFLDRQFRDQQTKASYWNTRSGALYYVEDVFNTIDSNSLDGVLQSFFNSIQEVSKNPVDQAVRTHMANEATRLSDVLRMYHEQLVTLMEHQDFAFNQQVRHTNEILRKISSLNDAIFRFEMGGSSANDLRDQRNLLLDELSSLVNVSYAEIPFSEDQNGPIHNIYGTEMSQLVIYAGPPQPDAGWDDMYDNLLVWHRAYFPLTDGHDNIYGEGEIEGWLDDDLLLAVYGETPTEDAESRMTFYKAFLGGEFRLATGQAWEGLEEKGVSGDDLELNGRSENGVPGYSGGELQSYLDLRDVWIQAEDIDPDYRGNLGIPYYISELNKFVNAFVQVFNSIHVNGFTAPYSGSASTTGYDFFNPEGLSANTIGVSEDIIRSVFNIAVSSEEVFAEPDGHFHTGNNEIALMLIAGMRSVELFREFELDTTAEGFYKNFLGNLASNVYSSNGMATSYSDLLASVQMQRESVSGVSEDEEMTNLIRFQHAYNASARCITTIDDMLDKLINGTGRVGL